MFILITEDYLILRTLQTVYTVTISSINLYICFFLLSPKVRLLKFMIFRWPYTELWHQLVICNYTKGLKLLFNKAQPPIKTCFRYMVITSSDAKNSQDKNTKSTSGLILTVFICFTVLSLSNLVSCNELEREGTPTCLDLGSSRCFFARRYYIEVKKLLPGRGTDSNL